MKKHNKLYPVRLTLVSLFGCHLPQTSVRENKEISVALCYETLENAYPFLKAFSQNNPDYRIKVNLYSSASLDYRRKHKEIRNDIIFSSELNHRDEAKESLLSFKNSEVLNRYNPYIGNFLSSDDGNIYCLPSLSSVYCYCLNKSLIEEYNLDVPKNRSDLYDFGERVTNYGLLPFCSSSLDEDCYLDLRAQRCIGPFFGTLKGYQFLREYLSGKTRRKNSPYLSEFEDTLGNLYQFSSTGFFDKTAADGTKKDSARFFAGDSLRLSRSASFDFEEAYKESKSTFDYEFLPYYGKNEKTSFVCTKSDFYVSVRKDSYTLGKKKAIDTFIDFFSSKDGQEILKQGTKGIRISYLKDSPISLPDSYKPVSDCIRNGRVYLIDGFYSAFTYSRNFIEDFAHGRLSTASLIETFDEEKEQERNRKDHQLANTFPEDCVGEDEEYFSSFKKRVASYRKKERKTDVLVREDSFVLSPLFSSTIYEDELDSIFDFSSSLVPVKITGKERKTIRDACFTKDRLDSGFDVDYEDIPVNLSFDFSKRNPQCGFTLSGAHRKGEKYFLNNNRRIEDESLYRVSLPQTLLNSSEISPVAKGVSKNCYSFILNVLNQNNRR